MRPDGGTTTGVPPGPPFDIDVLADLHAGVYPDDIAAVLRERAAADPEASAVLAALDATTDELRGWDSIAPVPMPAPYAARLDAAIAAESAAREAASRPPAANGGPAVTPATGQGPAPGNRSGADPGGRPGSGPAQISSLDEARQRRLRNRTRWATGLGVAAAVAAVLTVGAVILQPGATPGAGQAGELPGTTAAASSAAPTSHPGAAGAQPAPSAEPTDSPPLTGSGGPAQSAGLQNIVARPHHLDELLPELDSSPTAGPFTDPDRLAACMQANGASASDVLGVIPVTYQDQQAYAVSLSDGVGVVRILVVGPECGATGSDLIEQQTATR
jgi:hypothetical protein